MPLAAPCLLVACASDPSAPEPRLYEGFGGYAREVSTGSEEAQRWFDQGIQLLYGFNHDEAIRSFRAATDVDPTCAMAWWGIGYANGLDINNPTITESEAREAWEASREALRHVANAAPVEGALIQALSLRYEWPNPDERRHLDEAYADAMQAAWETFPTDADVGALYAESLMNLQPWDLWTPEGEPKGRTEEIVATLERVLEIDPLHPGANHFYIHAVEASQTPERAVPAAERLVDLVPGAGHLVHMPSHIFIRVGRYADASDANVRAIAADQAYFAVAPPPDFYALYFLHNVHFLAFASMMEGRRDAAIQAARDLESDVPQDFLHNYVQFADGLMATPLHVMIRFGDWEGILAEPEPADFRLLSRTLWHYARGVALSALGRTEEARAEQVAFEEMAAQVPDDWTVANNTAAAVIDIARGMLEGEVLYREGDHDGAFAALRHAVELEDALVYDEPPGWMQPVRHALGALLMGAERYDEAEAVYRADLDKNARNGWSLLGLQDALRAQGDLTGAAALDAELAAAWPRNDVEPTSSCYCEPGR